ncbi:MAG: hypothetical protein ACPLQS_02175 [Desulfurococcaceae archaeon]
MRNFYKYLCTILILLLYSATLMASTTQIPRIHVYSDGSVTVELSYSSVIRNTIAKKALLQGELNIEDSYYDVLVNGSLGTDINCEQGFNCTYVEFSSNASSSVNVDYYELNTELNLRIWDDKGNALNTSITSMKYRLNTSSLVGSLRGAIEFYATGESKQLLGFLIAVNKPLIDQYLAMHNVTWIKVNSLTTTISDNKARVEFEVELNNVKLFERAGLNATLIKQYYEKTPSFSSRVLIYYDTLNMFFEAFIRIHGDVNEHIKYAIDAYNLTHMQLRELMHAASELMNTRIMESLPGAVNVGSILGLIKEFTDNFNILKSRGVLVLELSDEFLTLNVSTPRLIKRDSRSPGDTLLALYDIAAKAQRELKAETLLDTVVELVPEKGVKIALNGTEVQQVKIRDIPDLEVTSTQDLGSQLLQLIIVVSVLFVLVTAILIAYKHKRI